MTYNFVENTANDKMQPLQAIVDNDGSIKFTAPNLGSSNFDGFIPVNTASAYVNNVNAGDYFSPSGSSTFYQVVSVEREDPSLTQTGSAYSGYQDIYYVDDNGELTSASFSSSATVVYLKNEEWESEERFLGNNGWIITSGGNAIFTNVAVRGRIEAKEGYIGGTDAGWEITDSLFSNASVGFYAPSATTGQVAIFAGAPYANRASAAFRVGYDGSVVASSANITGALNATTLNVGGSAGITYDGSVVTIGSSVVINSTLTTNSLQVGASPALLRIANDVDGTNDGIYIDPYNFWYSDGKFSVGGSANSACWNGSALSVKGNIIATSGSFSGALAASVGTIGGFTLAGSQLSASQVTLSSSGGLRLGATNQFSVDQSGNLVATSASITGNITANSGTFTGSISAQHITASTGSIAGFALANNQISTASVIVSSSGGFRLGNPTVFSVDQFGNLVASTASITGRINATSGSFSGDITASAGRFIGALSVSSSGAIYAGTNVDSGQRTVLNASGLFGFHSNGLEAFALPISGSPRIGKFTIIPTGIVSQSASNANMIYGNVDASGSVTDGIVIRGFRTSGASAAIYTVQNGIETSYAAGNGFYVDENARFKLKGATGSLAFDGNDLYVSGNINATSGQFTGSISAQFITASIGRVGGFILSASSITDAGGSASNVGVTTGPIAFFAGASDVIGSNSTFSVSNTGILYATAASIVGDSVINGTNIGNGGGNIVSNLRIGTSALGSNTTGSSNIAIGDYALSSNTSGSNNVAFGEYALYSNTIGKLNIAIGSKSIYSNLSASGNIAIGLSSQYSVTDGMDNISIGASSLYSNVNADRNIAIGRTALVSNLGDYNVAIGNENLFTLRNAVSNRNTSVGISCMRNTYIGSYNTAIGSTVLSGGSANYYGIGIGHQAARDSQGYYNIAIGADSLFLMSGSNNIAIGQRAGYNIVGGKGNVYINYEGLSLGSSETDNIYIANGSNELGLRIDESQKVYLYGDLSINTNAFYVSTAGSVGIGTATPASALHIVGGLYATGNVNIGNTASVISSLYVGTTGSVVSNLAVGGTFRSVGAASALSSLYIGGAASALSAFYIGGAASAVSTFYANNFYTGNNGNGTNFRVGDDVWIGDINCANVMSVRGVQNSAIGFISFGTDSASVGYDGTSLVYNGPIRFGDLSTLSIGGAASAVSSFYVGTTGSVVSNLAVGGTFRSVGAASALSSLYIGGAASAISSLYVGTTSSFVGNSNFGGTVIVGGNATFNSNVILGTSSATTEVRSQAIFDTLTANVATVQIAGAANNYRLQRSTASSRKWKHDIQDMPSVLQDVLNLRPVTFKYNLDYLPSTDNRSGLDVYGLIAEEVADIIPLAADYDEGQPSDWNYRILVPILIKAIQEQQKQIQELSDKINALGDNNG